jgi:hypothetical protein
LKGRVVRCSNFHDYVRIVQLFANGATVRPFARLIQGFFETHREGMAAQGPFVFLVPKRNPMKLEKIEPYAEERAIVLWHR